MICTVCHGSGDLIDDRRISCTSVSPPMRICFGCGGGGEVDIDRAEQFGKMSLSRMEWAAAEAALEKMRAEE